MQLLNAVFPYPANYYATGRRYDDSSHDTIGDGGTRPLGFTRREIDLWLLRTKTFKFVSNFTPATVGDPPTPLNQTLTAGFGTFNESKFATGPASHFQAGKTVGSGESTTAYGISLWLFGDQFTGFSEAGINAATAPIFAGIQTQAGLIYPGFAITVDSIQAGVYRFFAVSWADGYQDYWEGIFPNIRPGMAVSALTCTFFGKSINLWYDTGGGATDPFSGSLDISLSEAWPYGGMVDTATGHYN